MSSSSATRKAGTSSAKGGGRITTRRGFLAVSGAGGLGLFVGQAAHAGAGRASNEVSATRFAMVTDTHANVETPERSAHLARVLEHIESRDPAFVINCGDVTDVAASAEFELYETCVPDDLRARLRHVPGNHEEQWNIDAFEAYDSHFGPTYFSFDAGGIHMVAVDPIALKDWSWHFGPEQLRWLERDLRSVASGVPIMVVTHFPMGLDWHFAYDGEEFLRTIENYRVRGIFCGHIHRTSVSRFNGLTQVTGRSFKNGPFYYWVERVDGSSGPALEVTEVLVPAEGEATHQVIATMPIDDVGPGGNLGPLGVSTRMAGDALAVRVESPADAPTAEVMARLHPHGDTVQDWTHLDGAGRRWIGNLDLAGLPPGPHKIEVRAVDDADGVYDSSASFDIPTREVRVAWTTQTAGSVRGGAGAARRVGGRRHDRRRRGGIPAHSGRGELAVAN